MKRTRISLILLHTTLRFKKTIFFKLKNMNLPVPKIIKHKPFYIFFHTHNTFMTYDTYSEENIVLYHRNTMVTGVNTPAAKYRLPISLSTNDLPLPSSQDPLLLSFDLNQK